MGRGLVGVVLAASLCVATTTEVQAAQDPAKANALFKKAKEKLDGGEPYEALELVTRAAEYFEHPAIFLLKARTLRVLHRYGKALAVLESISARKAPKALRKVRSTEIAQIKAAMKTTGRLQVKVQPANAEVLYKGTTYKGGLDRWVDAGRNKVEISAPGYQATRRTVTVEAQGSSDIQVVLKKAVGKVRVVVSGGLKGVDVKIDGEVQDVSDGRRAGDVVTLTLPVGKREVACSRGALLELHKVTVALGKTSVVRCSQIAGSSKIAGMAIGWGGVAAGLALASYGAWGLQSYFADIEKAENQGLIADTNKHYGGALYLASGLAIGVTSYLLFVREPASDAGDTALAPVLGAPVGARAELPRP